MIFSMSIIENLVSIFGQDQLDYLRIEPTDYLNDPTSRPESYTPKIPVPSYFREIFSTGFNIQCHAPAGTENTLWHCLLYALVNERYTMACWAQRKKYVETLIQELDERVQAQYAKTSIVARNTRFAPQELKYRAAFITDDVFFVITACLDINIVVLTPSDWKFHYGSPVVNTSLPLLILNSDYQHCYSVVTINDLRIFNADSAVAATMAARFPKNNEYLQSIVRSRANPTDKDMEFVRQVKGQTTADMERQRMITSLSKLKVTELKEKCNALGISISGRMTKAQMVEAISDYQPEQSRGNVVVHGKSEPAS